MKVIGTAGHIDHGKSTLVYRLTGIDPDRLAEEKARGLTIDLGFAWLSLPSGVEASVVDVPGHERFVRNMLAGAAGVDVALLVVAADEAVMPQTREHLDILDLLGVEHGVVALTKSDLVDEEWLALAVDDVERLLEGTTLQGSPVIPVSSVTGSGLESLLAALDRAVAAAPGRSEATLPFLPVDRAFTIAGFGTVVTGTLHGGQIAVGQELELLPSGKRVKIRGLQTHKKAVDRASAGARVAANLAGLSREEAQRGDVLALPNTTEPTVRFDARIQVVRDAPFPLQSGTQATIHVGAAEAPGTVILLEGSVLSPGNAGWARIRTRQPLAVVRGQRFIVRVPTPGRTIAGGIVVDPRPSRGAGRRKRLDLLARIGDEDLSVAVEGVLESSGPVSDRDVAVRLSVPASVAKAELDSAAARGRAIRLGAAYVDAGSWSALLDTIRERLEAFHRSHPMRQGMSREELRQRVRWPAEAWPDAIRRLTSEGVMREVGAEVALPAHRGGSALRPEDAARVLRALREHPFSPPSAQELMAATGADFELLAAMSDEGTIVRIGDGLFVSHEAYEELVRLTLRLIEAEGQVTVARIRDETQTSRKYALALLEHLDGRRITRRVGDSRVLGARA